MRHYHRSWPNSSTWQRNHEAASAVMLRQAQQRTAARIFVRLPAWITIEARGDEHVAFVRDISPRGIFFYSDFCPAEGDPIGFVLEYLSGSNKTRMHLQGRVVRVEHQIQNSAAGIAVAFDAQHDEVPRFPLRPSTTK
jgi:hypothetical protein